MVLWINESIFGTDMNSKDPHPVIIGAVNVSGHAKVSYFDQESISHQAVPGCQIPVNKVLRRQVDHACRDLTGYPQHLGQTQLAVVLQRLSIDQYHGIWSVGSEKTIERQVRAQTWTWNNLEPLASHEATHWETFLETVQEFYCVFFP